MRVRVTQGDPRENEKRRAGQADPGAHKLKRQTQGETQEGPGRPTVTRKDTIMPSDDERDHKNDNLIDREGFLNWKRRMRMVAMDKGDVYGIGERVIFL